MRIHPRQVEAFRAVMLNGGITAAAAALHVTQPAVSRLIRDFEIETGLVLFDREGNRLVPRQEAHTLWTEVERVYVGLDHIGQTAEGIRVGRGNTLRVGAVTALSTRCVDHVLARFLDAFPDTVLTLETESSGRINDLVAMQYYDVGLVYLHGGHSAARGEVIGTGQAVCVMPKGHRLTACAAVTVADLNGEAIALPGRRTPLRTAFDAIQAESTSRPGRVIEAALHYCCRLAAQGLAVAVVDPLSADACASRLERRPFRPDVPVAYGALFAHGPARNHLARDFIDVVRDDLAAALAG
jgi:DNA-binding transcriptional LysR family regulator